MGLKTLSSYAGNKPLARNTSLSSETSNLQQGICLQIGKIT